MVVTTLNTSLPAAERYANGSCLLYSIQYVSIVVSLLLELEKAHKLENSDLMSVGSPDVFVPVKNSSFNFNYINHYICSTSW